MATMIDAQSKPVFYVIHPLKDVPEQKCDPDGLGRMPMKGATRVSLLVLRGYLILMVLLVLFDVLRIGGVVGR